MEEGGGGGTGFEHAVHGSCDECGAIEVSKVLWHGDVGVDERVLVVDHVCRGAVGGWPGDGQ
jgi:hypothetical protein